MSAGEALTAVEQRLQILEAGPSHGTSLQAGGQQLDAFGYSRLWLSQDVGKIGFRQISLKFYTVDGNKT